MSHYFWSLLTSALSPVLFCLTITGIGTRSKAFRALLLELELGILSELKQNRNENVAYVDSRQYIYKNVFRKFSIKYSKKGL